MATDSDCIRGTRNLAAAAANRSKTTVEQWCENGCPYKLGGGGTRIFSRKAVAAWCQTRGIDFDSKETEPSLLQQQKLRQETYKANELQYRERIRNREYAPVADFEDAMSAMLQQVARLMTLTVDDIIKRTKLKGKDAEVIHAELIKGFNLIADNKPEFNTAEFSESPPDLDPTELDAQSFDDAHPFEPAPPAPDPEPAGPKRGRGRPKMSDEEKAQRAAERKARNPDPKPRSLTPMQKRFQAQQARKARAAERNAAKHSDEPT